MNSRGGKKSIGLRPVRPYRMCRVRRTTEGDSIWSSSLEGGDQISKHFTEENEERTRGKGIIRVSIAERIVTFRGGARERRREEEIELQNIRPRRPRERDQGRETIVEVSVTNRNFERRKGNEAKSGHKRERSSREEPATEAERERWSERAIIEDLNGWAGSR